MNAPPDKPATRAADSPPHLPDRHSPLSLQQCPVHNRIAAVMAHIPWYSLEGLTRLAQEAGVSKSALSRLLSGQSRPSFALVWKLTKALEKRLGKALDPCELVSLDGTYPTPSVCVLCGCSGCLPEEVYDDQEKLRPEYQHLKPGAWSIAAGGKVTPALAAGKEAR